jgi:hypothetical protein
MRLIDADKLKEVFDRNVVSAGVWNEIIDMQPTAYDVDKVVEQLKAHNYYSTTVDEAVKIVKGGVRGMNNQEAIQEFKTANKILKNGDNGAYDVAKTIVRNDLAIAALEQQIPKKPRDINNSSIRARFKSGNCPECDAYIDTDDDLKFCTECGQSLDWGNEK